MPLLDHLVCWADADPFQWGRYGLSELVVGARSEYRVAANWKLIVENYNECLHCPTVHPALTELIPVYRVGEVEERPGQSHGNLLRDGATSFTFSGTSDCHPARALARRPRRLQRHHDPAQPDRQPDV